MLPSGEPSPPWWTKSLWAIARGVTRSHHRSHSCGVWGGWSAASRWSPHSGHMSRVSLGGHGRTIGRSNHAYRYDTCFTRNRYNHDQCDADAVVLTALVEEVKITGPDRLVPIFRVPRPDAPRDAANVETGDTDRPKPTRPATPPAPHRGAAAVLPATTPPKGAVRAMPTLVEVRGLEPLASSVRGRRSTRLSYTPWSF